MAYALQTAKNDTLNGLISSGATSATLTTGNFGSPTGTQLLVIDYDNASLEVISCTIAGTALTSLTRGLDGTSAVSHANGAKVIMALVPSHYTQLGALASSDGFPSWTPTCTGFSGTPTTTGCRYLQVGKLVIAPIAISGTSNTTGFTFTAPVAVKTGYNLAGNYITDNGTASLNGLLVATGGGSTTVTVFTSAAGGGWTASGTKGLNAVFIFEAA